MHEIIKKILKESGEVMIKTADGKEFELHLHNTEFDDSNKLIVVDTGTEKYWILSEEIIYLWIHKKV